MAAVETRIVIVPMFIRPRKDGSMPAVESIPALIASVEQQIVKAVEKSAAFRSLQSETPEAGTGAASTGSVVYTFAPPQAARQPDSAGNPLRDFLTACCEIRQGHFECVSDVARTYQWWCNQNPTHFPLSRLTFSTRLEEAGFRQTRSRRVDGKQCRTWEGLRLLHRQSKPDQADAREAIGDVRSQLRRLLTSLEGM